MVLGESGDSIADRVLVLRDTLRAQKIKLDKAYTLPVLGILALLPVEIETIARDIGKAQDTLRAKKGFGSLSVTTQELLLFAASIVASDYTESVKGGIDGNTFDKYQQYYYRTAGCYDSSHFRLHRGGCIVIIIENSNFSQQR